MEKLKTRRFAGILAIAAAYFVAGQLGLLLSIPAGYATAVGPASGIALAGLLLFGYRLWPGVFLGAFLANLGTSFDASGPYSVINSLFFPIGVGIGAALQALAGSVLVKRFVPYEAPLSRPDGVLKLLGLGGAAGCVVGATWGVATLAALELLKPGTAFSSWWTWWVGDTIGVLIFTPLALYLASYASSEAPSVQKSDVSSPEAVVVDGVAPRGVILLAEDDTAGEEGAITELKKMGFEVHTVGNGKDAIQTLESSAYDLVLMDCQMPEMDGFETTRRIRASEKGTDRHVTIIALTANAAKDDEERCLQSGMDDCLSKPIRKEHLAAKVSDWLSPGHKAA